MADNNNNNFNFPPPPSMTPPRGRSPPPPGTAAPPPSLPAHTTTESIPHLSSAPPSGNPPVLMPQQQPQFHPPPPMQPPPMHHTQVRMPPPPILQQQFPMPPAPPQRQMHPQQIQQHQMMTMPPPPSVTPPPPQPTIQSLTPPPAMSIPSSTSSSPAPPHITTTVASSTFATASPLPPPPVMSGLAQPKPPPSPTSSTTSTATSQASYSTATAPAVNAKRSSSDPSSTTYVPATEEPSPPPLSTFCPPNVRYLAHRQSHIPIMVLGTESAHRLAWKNQLRLVDMLEGLARTLPDYTTRGIPPVRSPISAKSLSLQWRDVPLTFVTPDQLAQPMSYDKAQDLLQAQAQLQEADGNLADELNLLEDQVDALLQDAPKESSYDYMSDYEVRCREHAQVVKDAFSLTSPANIPWALRYRHALDATTDQMPHDLFACPPVCLLICTTQEVSPLVDCLRELGSRHYLPHCYNNGLYDPKGLRHEALVLHDTVEGPRDWDEAGLRSSLQRHFGPNASIVRINGIQPTTAMQLGREETADEWGGGGKCGNCLSHSDRVVLRQYLESLTTSSVLPALERRMSDLNVVVSDRKKGVKNVLKSFWRKPKEANPEETVTKATSEVTYRFDSVESQTRLLADTLFLMKDYDAALGMYRLIRDDYKHDKAMMHYASVQEMMALCMYFLDPYSRAKDIVSHIETALLAYSKAAEDERPTPSGQNKNQRSETATHATRCATRLCLWLASTSDTILGGRHLEVADLLASASSHETSLGAAVLLEQSSAQYYHANMYRKYAFHMLMSGHMFRTAQQEAHAFRCFTSALYLYRDKPWSELHNHLRSALAAQLYAMGRMSVSVQLYARLVGIPSGGSVSVKSQQKFVNNLLYICSEYPKKALVGADRMAAPSELSSRERDEYRRGRLDGIVEVIQFTPGAQRILELPRVHLPTVDDSSIVVETPEDVTSSTNAPSASMGTLGKGADSVWNALKMTATAELKAYDVSKDQSTSDEVTTKALSKIQDTDIRKVIAQIDKATQNRNLRERNKRSSNYKGESPPIRARGEPLRVNFTVTNPLSIPVDLSDVQLVAQVTDSEGRVFTNSEAIKITSTRTGREPWKFQSSSLNFEVADFSRLSPPSSEDGNKAWAAGEDVDEPYFVVSKHSINLEEQGTTSMSLGICPLVEGDLDILGVRSKLFGDVWLYHPFNVQGARLHNTRENRSNRVRAEPVLLKATIKNDMPCLTAWLMRPDGDKGEDHLLQGQRGNWILRLSNIGTASATKIALKTNLPWINIPTKDDLALEKENTSVSKLLSLENKAKSFCIGPTGTLMNLPVEGSHLKKQGCIQPGEMVDVPIEIKAGGGGGSQDFYMLYRYELDTPLPPQSGSSPHRWLKRLRQVPVYPSLSLTASVLPSTFNKSEHILSVELTNHRNDRPSGIKVALNKLSLFSRQYRMERMTGQLLSGDATGVQVDWRERVTVHYRLIPMERESSTCLLSECSFAKDTTTLVEGALFPTSTDYLCLEKACAEFEGTWNKHQSDLLRAQSAKDREEQHPQSITQIRKANTGQAPQQERQTSSDGLEEVDIGAAHPTSVSKLFPTDRSYSNINLICSWSAEMGNASGGDENAAGIVGEHYLRSVSVRPAVIASECPITISARHPSTMSHDFQLGAATVPFQFTLRNQLVKSQVKFLLQVEQPKHFDFVGSQSLQWTLDGSEELTLPMKAVIPCPGVYNLQSLKILVDEGDGDGSDAVAYDFAVQWIVNVSPSEQ